MVVLVFFEIKKKTMDGDSVLLLSLLLLLLLLFLLYIDVIKWCYNVRGERIPKIG